MNKTPSHYYGLILIISLPINTTMNWKSIRLEFVKAIHMPAIVWSLKRTYIIILQPAHGIIASTSSLLNDSVF